MTMTEGASGWQTSSAIDLEAAISEFKAALPGWWYSLGECQVSCDASCAPTDESEHIALIGKAGDPFDTGFHADLRQPSSLAGALRDVMGQALLAIAAASNPSQAFPDGNGDRR